MKTRSGSRRAVSSELRKSIVKLNPLALSFLAAGWIATPAHALDHLWSGGTGDWANFSNWTPLGVPGNGDTATLNGGNPQVTFAELVGGLVIKAGTLSGAGTLTVTGQATLTGGAQSGSGTTVYNGPLSINGTHYLAGGGRLMQTNSTTTWSTGNVAMNGSNTITNNGTWLDNTLVDSHIGGGNYGSAKVFNNVGSFIKSGNTTTNLYTAVNNAGTVRVDAGRLNLVGHGNSTSTGSFHITEGTTLSFGNGGSGGVATLDNATFSGTGRLLFATSNNYGTDVRLLGSSSHTGLTQVSSGDLQIDGSLTASTFLHDGGDVSGAGALTVTGQATLTGGAQSGSGTTVYNGPLSINGTHYLAGGGRLMQTNSTTTWSTGNVAMNGSNTITNNGTWLDNTLVDSHIGGGNYGSAKVFNNVGSFIKSGNTTTNLYTAVNNAGSVSVNQGTLAVSGAINNQGDIEVAAPAVFHGNTKSFLNEGLIAGLGTVRTYINDDLVNAGRIAPGIHSIGTLTIDGGLSMTATSDLLIELGGSGFSDLLAITDDVKLGGTLSIYASAYSPVAGDEFVIMTFDERVTSSLFDNVVWHDLGAGYRLDVIYNEHNVTLAVAAVPEASTLWMALSGIGLVGLSVRVRRRTVH